MFAPAAAGLAVLYLLVSGPQVIVRVDPPIVTVLTPNSGIVGSTVVMTGQHFGPAQENTVLTLNGVPVVASAWADTSVTFLVPSTSTGSVMMVRGGVASNALAYTVTVVSANPIDSPRHPSTLQTLPEPEWAAAGATISERTVHCADLGTSGQVSTFAQSVTAAQINAAVVACPSGDIVFLNAGTYSIGAGGILLATSGVTLKGAGADQTLINFTVTDACAVSNYHGLVCIGGGQSGSSWDGAPNTATWDGACAGGGCAVIDGTYTRGGTRIHLTRLTGAHTPVAGDLLELDQCNDGLSGNGACPSGSSSIPATGLVVGDGTIYSSDTGQTFAARLLRDEFQVVQVIAVSGGCALAVQCTIDISPGVYPPNIASARSPNAGWFNAGAKHDIGLEDVTLNGGNFQTSSGGMINVMQARNVWIRRVRGLRLVTSQFDLKHVKIAESINVTVRDSYFYGSKGWDGTAASNNESYGVTTYAGANTLVENNIFVSMSNPMMTEDCQACVFGYNYSINDLYLVIGSPNDPHFQQAGSGYNHSAGSIYLLNEGQDVFAVNMDDTHGSSNIPTVFRSVLNGVDDLNRDSKTEQTIPIELMSHVRFGNMLGNVLGKAGYATNYTKHAATTTDTAGSGAETAIYRIGYSETNGGHNAAIANDPYGFTSLYRYWNWDVTHASNTASTNDTTGIQTTAGEVPTALTDYPQTQPDSALSNLPTSLYLSSKPTFFNQASITWPPIGPDVTSGNISNMGGHANKIPARVCYESLANDTVYTGGQIPVKLFITGSGSCGAGR